MIKLYFGNVANFISTVLLAAFFVVFIKTIKSNQGDINWKRMSVFIFIFGIVLSATGGIKDTHAIKPAITFGTLNFPFILLCSLGVIATILGIIGIILKQDSNMHKGLFYTLSIIIITKTIVLEGIRIKGLF